MKQGTDRQIEVKIKAVMSTQEGKTEKIKYKKQKMKQGTDRQIV